MTLTETLATGFPWLSTSDPLTLPSLRLADVFHVGSLRKHVAAYFHHHLSMATNQLVESELFAVPQILRYQPGLFTRRGRQNQLRQWSATLMRWNDRCGFHLRMFHISC